jgi:hypothetical protein
MKILVFLLTMILFATVAISEDIINGHYCYTYGDKESLTEARQLTRTLAIRNAVESYKAFVDSTTIVTDSALTGDIIQVLSSGYIKRVKTTEHTEKDRTICETIIGYIEPAKFEQALRKGIESRQRKVEERGIDNNGILKILSAELKKVPFAGQGIEVVVKSFVRSTKHTGSYDMNYVCIDYFGINDQPIGGHHIYVKDVVPDQIATITFSAPAETKSFRVWLPKIEKSKEDMPKRSKKRTS